MQVNRERLLELAIQGGATIDNAERVASAWEKWVKDAKDSWPTPFDETSSPAGIGSDLIIDAGDGDKIKFVWNGNKVKGVYLRDGRFTVKKPSEPEIDWSRPQLVTNGHGLVLRTTGYHGDKAVTHGEPWFEGEVVNMKWNHFEAGDIGTDWHKAEFTYHGEIEEPKNPGKQEPEIDWSRPQLVISNKRQIVRTDGKCNYDETFSGVVVDCGRTPYNPGYYSILFRKSDFVYHGEIPQEQQELKTTGLDFLEAIKNAGFESPAVASREDGVIYYFNNNSELVMDIIGRSGATNPRLTMQDLSATDWQIITP